MKSYLELLDDILTHGRWSGNRTGVRTIKVFDRTLRMDLSQGFPALTTKKIHMRSVVGELLWFLSGSTNNNDLVKRGVTIWNEWADERGHLGPIYGRQWRHFPAGTFFITMDENEIQTYIDDMASDQKLVLTKYLNDKGYWETDKAIEDTAVFYDALNHMGIDQVNEALKALQNTPNSRRIIVTAWNPQVIPDEGKSPVANVHHGRQSLAACHNFYQFVTAEMTIEERMAWYSQHKTGNLMESGESDDAGEQLDSRGVPKYILNCSFNMRSIDSFLGLPFNIASYALLTHMFAQVLNMVPGELVWHGVDTHLYENQLDQVKLQLSREPKPLPELRLNEEITDLFKFQAGDIRLVNYDPHPAIKAEVAV